MNTLRTLLLALFLVAIGFVVGYGYQARGAHPATPGLAPTPAPQAPLVKGLHASPDGSLLAFTGVYDNSSRAGVWIVNARTGASHGQPSPAGWQDFVTQWRSDGRTLLIEREKIPRPVASATAGLYLAPVDRATSRAGALEPALESALPRGEKIVTGILAPDGELVVKTRREPKSLFLLRDGAPILVDRAAVTYGQNRPVREGSQLVFYVVRDVPGSEGAVALFRVQNGHARALSPLWNDVAWSYVAPSGRQIIVARQASNGKDWEWTLFAITPNGVRQLRRAVVPGDVISVYWSPDEKRVLGAAGQKLWTVAVPSLQVQQLGSKSDWNADDASWMGNAECVIAENGEIWRVSVPSGKATRLWRFPATFWK